MELQARIIADAEKSYEIGHNLFPAKSILASVALWGMRIANPENADTLRLAANDSIMQMLAARGAQGEIYAVRHDLGNGEEDGGDTVIVHSREGNRTHQLYHGSDGSKIVIRASTEDMNSDSQ